MNASGRRFRAVDGEYAICRLCPQAAVPEWAAGALVSVTRTDDELSIVCSADRVPPGVRAERGWRILKLVGPLPFGEVGVLASVAGPLARAGISVLAVATFDTDYVLVPGAAFDRAVAALGEAGYVRDA